MLQVSSSDDPKDPWARESWTQCLYYKCGRLGFAGSEYGQWKASGVVMDCLSWRTQDARHLNRQRVWFDFQRPSGSGMPSQQDFSLLFAFMFQLWFAARHLDSMEALFRSGGITLWEDNTNFSQSARNQKLVPHQSTTSTNALSVLLVLITESQWTRSTRKRIALKNVSLPRSLALQNDTDWVVFSLPSRPLCKPMCRTEALGSP